MKRLLAIIFTLCSITSTILASSRNVKSSLYPNSKLEASLTASSGQATIIAVRSLDDKSVVILSVSPKKESMPFNSIVSQSGSVGEDDVSSIDQVHELTPILDRGAVRIPYIYNTKDADEDDPWHNRERYTESRIMHLLQEKSGLCLFMTGFKPDVEYLVRCAAGYVSGHEHLYGGESPSAQMVVRDTLSPCLRDATMSGGSRPFGVQGLVVGHARSSQGSPVKMQIITLDPSGNWRYWQHGGVAIGKDANIVKKHLRQALETKENTGGCLTWIDALDVAMKSLLESMKESQNMNETPRMEILSEIDALVICGKGIKHRHPCAFVSRSAISKSFLKCLETIDGNSKANTK